MGWKLWKNNKEIANLSIIRQYPILVRTSYLITIIVLSLLLPLSFLLLARLSSASYILSLTSNPPPNSLLYSLFLHTNPNLIHALVSIISITTLINALTGRVSPLNELSGPTFQTRLHVAWIYLCTLQVCVGLGIEATISVGVDRAGFENNKSVLTMLVFFLGLHETMIHWARTIVRPVVDDTMYAGAQEERWLDRLALAAAFSALSWWRLRDEVEALVVVVEVKRDMMMKIGFGDFISWWLFYLMVVIGMAKIFKAILWFVMSLCCRRRRIEDYCIVDYQNNENKV